jgi:hypothetical protein
MPSNKLEQAAIIQRAILIPQNAYNDAAPANEYTATHTKALADATTPEQGRGTGAADPQTAAVDYNGGTNTDKFGNPTMPGSGRQPAFSMNQYNLNNGYTAPDTSLNQGQVVID